MGEGSKNTDAGQIHNQGHEPGLRARSTDGLPLACPPERQTRRGMVPPTSLPAKPDPGWSLRVLPAQTAERVVASDGQRGVSHEPGSAAESG